MPGKLTPWEIISSAVLSFLWTSSPLRTVGLIETGVVSVTVVAEGAMFADEL